MAASQEPAFLGCNGPQSVLVRPHQNPFKSTQAIALTSSWLALILLTPALCFGQARLDFTGFTGLYAPASPVIIDETILACPGPAVCPRLTGAQARQKVGPVLGGALVAWLSRRFAVQLSMLYADSRVTGFGSSFGATDTAAHIVIGNALLRASILSLAKKGFVSVALGWGFESRGGPAYRAYLSGATTNWGPSVGISADYATGGNTAVFASVDDQRFSMQFRDITPTVLPPSINQPPSDYQEPFRRTQNDLIISLGVSFKITGRPIGHREQ